MSGSGAPGGGSGEAVAAIDATFSAPKSVSAAWAIADPELRSKIEAAHEQAIDRALTYATGQVPMLRRRVNRGKTIHEKASGLVATSSRDTTARAVDQQIPDPQLHSHVLLHAAVRRDGRLVAIDSRSWLVHQREVGAAYRTELAHELAKLGFDIRRGTRMGAVIAYGQFAASLMIVCRSRRASVPGSALEFLADCAANVGSARRICELSPVGVGTAGTEVLIKRRCFDVQRFILILTGRDTLLCERAEPFLKELGLSQNCA